MPIYEFYCADCHTIFNFFSRTIDTEKRPACPRCNRPKLERRMSRFAISRGRTEPSEAGPDDPLGDLDEAKMERVMGELAREADRLDEDDPVQAARMMRKLYDAAGLPPNKGIEEAIRRMEAGEDPDKIEEEMGDVLEGEDALFGEKSGRLRNLARRLKAPAVDETLYDM